ncbi:MAG: hypothetical protein HC908_18215 [Calothrix sp. SM1_7_51]|nr:hypothetical protein [Calothrix sp. SM1_7_51]
MSRKPIDPKIKLSFAIIAMVLISTVDAVRAQNTPSPIFGDVTVRPKFSEPLTVRGMSGGSVSGNQVAGRSDTATGPCTGFVDEKPDHSIVLTSKFDYLKLQVQSPEDTTIIVKGPGGTWCNDEFDQKNPGIVGEWLPGNYNVWVGSYKKNQYLPYTLQITEVK